MAGLNSPVEKSRIWYGLLPMDGFPEVVCNAFRKAWC